MARKRFNQAERDLLIPGARIEWQNVTQWHPGTVGDGVIHTEDGWQHANGTNLARTARMSPGAIRLTPGHVRAVTS